MTPTVHLTKITQTIWTREGTVRERIWCEAGRVVRGVVLDSGSGLLLRTLATGDTMTTGLLGASVVEVKRAGFTYAGTEPVYRDAAGTVYITDGRRFWPEDPERDGEYTVAEVVVTTVHAGDDVTEGVTEEWDTDAATD